MRILLDIDDTIANLISIWLNYYNKDYADHVCPEDITDWDLSKFVKPECGKKIYDYIEDPDLYNEIEPLEHAFQFAKAIRSFPESEIIWCTASTQGSAGRKKQWLKEHGFWNDKDHYVETSSKHLINCDMIIDDNYKNIVDSNAEIKLLVSRPWNLKFPYSPRINDYQDFINTIEAI